MVATGTLINNAPSGTSHRYTRESVERALTVHVGEGGARGWQRKGSGYTVSTGIGIITLRTVREAAIFVVACREKQLRLEHEAATAASAPNTVYEYVRSPRTPETIHVARQDTMQHPEPTTLCGRTVGVEWSVDDETLSGVATTCGSCRKGLIRDRFKGN